MNATAYSIDGVDTREPGYSGAHAKAAWREWSSMVHGEFRVDFTGDSFTGRTYRQRTETFQLVSWTSDREHVRRERRGIERDPRGHYELLLPLKNTLHVGVNGPDHTLNVGDMALTPIDSPFHLAHGDEIQGLMLLIPPQRIEGRLDLAGSRGLRIVADTGLACVSRDLLLSVFRERHHLTGVQFDAAVERALDLVALAAAGEETAPPRSGDAAVLAAVRRHVRRHATDLDFSVGSMATAIGWSSRYVQAVLARAGMTASELVRQERLELARLRLGSDDFRDQSIADVAMSVGFQSPSAFSAAFRRHFGVAPREFRRIGGDLSATQSLTTSR